MKFFGMKNAGKSCVLRFEEKKIDDDRISIKTEKTLVCAACSASICSKPSHQVLPKQALQPLAQYLRTAFGLAAQPRNSLYQQFILFYVLVIWSE